MTVIRRKKGLRRAGLKSKTRSEVVVAARPLVLPGHEPKSGCRWCPLFPWSSDFPCGGDYNRDAEKIVAKEPEGHAVRNRCVQEPWEPVDILCVGDAVGANEDKSATPFMGQGGALLRSAIEALCETTLGEDGTSLLTKEQFGFTSLARCRPPRNKKPGKTIVQSCAPQLVRELKERKPKVIVAMGGVALEHLTGQTGIVMFSGRVLDCVLDGFEHIKVVACIAPAYVCRMDHEMPRFIEAFEQVRDVALGKYEALPGEGEYFVLDTLDAVRELIEMYEEDGTKVAVDTETGSLYWFQTEFPALLCFSLTNRAGEGYVIPLDHCESPWRVGGPLEHERKQLFALIGRLLENPEIEKILQNGKFDHKHMFHATGYRLTNYRDTMLTHLVLDERKGTHGLKQLAYPYTGMGGYDEPMAQYRATHPEANPKRGGSFANIPAEFLFPYAAMDADVTFRCDDGLLAEPEYTSNPKFQTLAEVFLPALAVALADMEYEGAQVDSEVVEQLDAKYTAQMAQKTEEVAAFPEVRDYADDPDKIGDAGVFNPGSGPQLQQVLFGLMGETPIHLTKGGRERVALRYNNAVAAWRKTGKGRKPRFQSLVRAAIVAQEWNLFATDAEVLHELERNGNALCPLILQYREAETLHGTFVKPLKYGRDSLGRIHGNFNIHGTVTGRLSSDDPNLQNIPNKGGALIKSAYVSRFGGAGLIGQTDYSQAELRVAASLFNEPTMIDTYLRGEDMHLNTALDLFGQTKAQYEALDSHEQKRRRTQAKRINFGCVPMDTEALTREGWKGYGDLSEQDEVLGWADGRLVWTPVRRKVRYEDAPIMEMRTSNFSVRTTPNHRWLVKRRRDGGACGRYHEDGFSTTETLAQDESIYLSAPILAEDRSGLTIAEAALVGWIVTDGSSIVHPLTGRTAQGSDGRRRKIELSVFQSLTANPEKVRDLDELFEAFEHARYVRPKTGIVQWKLQAQAARDLWAKADLLEDGGSLEDLVRKMGSEQVQFFLHACREAEGCGQYVSQNEGPICDAIELAAFLCGHYVNRSGNGTYKDNRNVKLSLRKPCLTGQRVQRELISTEDVWCIKTDCETWVMRQGGRIMLTGNSLYGGGPPALQTALRKEGDFLSLDECEELVERFFEVRPKLKAGIEALEASVCSQGYLESFTGRRRRIPEVFSEDEQIVARALRQSVNFPVQNGASEMTLISLVLIWNAMQERGYRSKMILTVHDSIIFDLHVDEAYEVMALAKHSMEHVVELSDAVFPGLDWSWLKVPVVCDCELGTNWKTLVDFDPDDFDEEELWERMAEKNAV